MDGIELIDLHKHYRQGATVVRALDGVSLRIQSGDFVSIVGRSGSGKTTLLDLMGLLLKPSSGAVRLDGVDTARLSARGRADLRGRRIGFVFQEYNLLPSLSVLENVTLPLHYVRGSSREGHRRALRLLELVGLADRAHTRPLELSGGQQQRVAIAPALVMNPALVLADEPTGAVDTETSEQIVTLMRTLNRDEGITFVIVTHDLELAARTDRMIRLRDGRIVGDHSVEAGAGQLMSGAGAGHLSSRIQVFGVTAGAPPATGIAWTEPLHNLPRMQGTRIPASQGFSSTCATESGGPSVGHVNSPEDSGTWLRTFHVPLTCLSAYGRDSTTDVPS